MTEAAFVHASKPGGDRALSPHGAESAAIKKFDCRAPHGSLDASCIGRRRPKAAPSERFNLAGECSKLFPKGPLRQAMRQL